MTSSLDYIFIQVVTYNLLDMSALYEQLLNFVFYCWAFRGDDIELLFTVTISLANNGNIQNYLSQFGSPCPQRAHKA